MGRQSNIMSAWLNWILSLLVGFTSFMQVAPAQPSPTEKLLVEMQQELARAWVAGDRVFIERVIAQDWTGTGPTGVVTTRAQLLAPTFEQRIQRIDRVEIDNVQVRVFGDSAVVTGRTHSVGSINGVAYDVRLRFTDIFVKRSGQWQVVASHGSLLPQ